MIRVGHGFDTHAFEADKPLVLGGVTITHTHGMKAHSDGDVVLHALVDALLGALALGDIGTLFPDTDPANAGRNSREFLASANNKLQELRASINNVDITIIAEAPKMAGHIRSMRQVIADDLRVDINQVNIKATRNEGMGHLGRKEGIAVHAVVLVEVVV